jgi:toxin ParE1/3/4
MMRYVLSPRAQSDLGEIWDYTVQNWSVEQAESYVRAIWSAIDRIADNPGRGRPCDDVRPGYFKFASGSHILFYRQISGGIDVVRILHKRMDFDRHL